MASSLPDLALDDVLLLVKGFVDMLVLASGYRSSGLEASWDAANVANAVRWAAVLEKVFRRILASNDCNDSVKELDAALLEMTSHSRFPQGLSHLSSQVLANARGIILEHLLQTHSLRDTRLRAILSAVVDLDLEDLPALKDTSIDVYVEKLFTQMKFSDSFSEKEDFLRDALALSLEDDASGHGGSHIRHGSRTTSLIWSNGSMKFEHVCNSTFLIHELLRRQSAISGLCSAETNMDALVGIINRSFLNGLSFSNTISRGNDISPWAKSDVSVSWSHWKTSSVSYLLNKRTIKLLSGAKLIFTVPKDQWFTIFETLKVTMDGHADNLLEIIELAMLGLASDRWKHLIERFMSTSLDSYILKIQYGGHDFLRQFEVQNSKGETIPLKENNLMEFLMVLLGSQSDMLWRFPPVLVAAAVPAWSTLFRMYIKDITKFLNGAPSSIRRCDCIEVGENHQSCEIAERAWCLHVVHSQVGDL